MVKVITIMDDVYAELYKIKRSRGMSFSEVLRYLVSQEKDEKSSIIDLAGSINEEDIDRHLVEKIRRSTTFERG